MVGEEPPSKNVKGVLVFKKMSKIVLKSSAREGLVTSRQFFMINIYQTVFDDRLSGV